MKLFIIPFLLFSLNLSAQSINKTKLQGCENPKGKEMTNICNSNLNQLIGQYFDKYYQKYGERIPQGEANLVFTITKTGEISNIKYSDYSNEQFAKLGVLILNDIRKDYEKYNIRICPAIDKVTNEPVDLEMKVPFKFIME